MDNNQVIELFQGRGMLESGLKEELKNQLESSGKEIGELLADYQICLLYTSPSPRDQRGSRMPSSA